MTLIEALKSGRRVKREGEFAWHRAGPWTEDEILDVTWEVEPVTVTITKEALAAAWYQAFDVQDGDEGAWDRLCKALGL